MNFVNLKYFLVVAQEMSFTKAAQKLYLSQQALSGHIRRLEAECGTALFERSPKLKLTYAGTCVAQHAVKIIDLEGQMAVQLSDITNLRSGHLSIGTSHARGRVFLPEVLPLYAQRYPTIELTLHTGISRHLEQMLLDGELDILIGFPPFNDRMIETIRVVKERLCLVVPHNIMEGKFPNMRTVATHFIQQGADISAFSDQPFLMMRKGNRVRDMADQFLSKHEITPEVLIESADIETLLGLCARGMGPTFSFETFAQKVLLNAQNSNGGGAYIFPFQDSDLESEIVMAFHKERYQSKAAKDFVALTQEVFSNANP